MGVALAKLRCIMNKIVTGWEQKRQHPVKYSLFDILSIMDQLYRSWSKVLERLRQRHIYFSKNWRPDCIADEIGNLPHSYIIIHLVGRQNQCFTKFFKRRNTKWNVVWSSGWFRFWSYKSDSLWLFSWGTRSIQYDFWLSESSFIEKI